jgi:thiamine biosynthesis lipoprotein
MPVFNKILVLFMPLLAFLFFQKEDQRQYTIQGYAQGTDYTIKYFARDSSVTKGEIDSILMAIDSSMSLYKPYSSINQFNASAKGLRIDRHFTKVMTKSFEIYKSTQGRFDVTVKPLVQAWGFGTTPVKKFADSTEVKEILKCVGMDFLSLEDNELKKQKPCVQIDLNGIAQGYSVDVVAEYLKSKGLKIYVVEIGGELRIKGPKPDGTSLRIGIEGPAEDTGTEPVIRHILEIDSGAITTSGNYRRFLQMGKKKVSHLIDPKSGYPLDNSMISVTIYARDAMTADGYDNAVMAMDVEEAIDFVSSKKNMEAYIIYHRKDGSVADTLTKGFKQLMVN